MKFKKLEVAGFKSFADRLEIKFGNGITGIVGPNGCGKSNVADSIRWVLGEQSAKLLRGSSMQDVIFNGTENRKSLSFCEVNLYFDNTEKLFPTLDFNEVVISRKLYRSGESEYLLNKESCRLKDITELLRDSGMGREGYSIIGQGRIDELLSSKPEDRRAIFEEAAGVSKFKARKVDAERKLARTADNLSRVKDILEEKARQLEPLTRQSENARKWLAFRDSLKTHEINIYIHQYETASDAKKIINERLKGIIEELELRNNENETVNKEYYKSLDSVNTIDKQIESLRDELLSLTVGIEKATGEMNLLTERLANLKSQQTSLLQENEKGESDHVNLLKLIDALKKEIDNKNTELKIQQKKVDEISEKYLSVVDELTKGEGEEDSRHRKLLETMDKLADIKSNMSRLVAEKEAINESSKDLKERINVSKQKVDEEEEKCLQLKSSMEQLHLNRDELIKKQEELYTQSNESILGVENCASKLDKLAAEYHTVNARLKMFKEMREANESFAYSVKKLLADAKNNADVNKRIEGIVASLIKVDSKFEVAIEMALGSAVQNIVTKNEEDAKFLVQYLKQHSYGRATFLPMTALKPRDIADRFKGLMSEKGCFGKASDLVKYEKKYDCIIAGLLGGTVICDNMDTAVALARKSSYGFRIVTLEGDVVNTQGSITGGSKKSNVTNIFSYDREIDTLEKTVSDIELEIKKVTATRQELAKLKDDLQTKVKISDSKIHELEIDIAAKTESYKKSQADILDDTKNIGNLEFELNKQTQRFDFINNEINSVSELENQIAAQKQSENNISSETRASFDILKKTRDELNDSMHSAKMNVSDMKNFLFNSENELKRLQSQSIEILEKIEYNSTRIEEQNKLIEKINTDMAMFVTSGSEEDANRVKNIRKELANLDDYKKKAQENMGALDVRRNELITQIQTLNDKKSKEEMLLLKVDTDIDQMQERILEEYELTYETCLPFKEDGYDVTEGSKDAAKLKRQMSALGHVNLDAIEQCKEVFASYNELDVQAQDLVKAQTDLETIIADLSREMLLRFEDKFEQIRVNFVKIFKELFNGGNADLVLQESDNPLEAGIEIVAQPPEKKLQSISLLSGGERALTAIAILFAILRLRPMPFCVLDEIEAALDDANAGRFASYLRRFSEGTQFIVITHRKPTMELADSLYGVTMEEKGVSKIVSVKLSDAVKVAEQAS